jgi:hypothetical protein
MLRNFFVRNLLIFAPSKSLFRSEMIAGTNQLYTKISKLRTEEVL